MRIVFMGTPDFAVASLEVLHSSEIEVAAVITAADKPAGRGRKMMMSSVKSYALQHNIPVLQPANLKDPGFIEELAAIEADLFVVVAFRMLPKIVWEMPRLGTINLHASLLPDYRGAAPINWAVINGEKKSGITTFFINEKIDTGDMLLQKEVNIAKTDTAGDLHDKLMSAGAKLLLETVRGLDKGSLRARPQPLNVNAKAAPKLDKENTRLDFSKPAEEVYNLVRGLSPYPASHSTLHNNNELLNCKILRCESSDNVHGNTPGSIQTDNRSYLSVQCGEGSVNVLELQLEGKKRMLIKDLLNGFSFAENACFR
tara:strand:+ start:628 stop:1569 length:942 start_codon:yes stop_codon:yes gene_type:complete